MESPVAQLLAALDTLDVDAAMKLLAPDARLMTVDGRRASGHDAVRRLLSDFLGTLRWTAHRVLDEWHPDNVWIAEVEASYELRDYLLIEAVPRAFVLRDGPDGVIDVRVYGARERPLTEHRTGEEGTFLIDRWIPPL